MRQTCLSTSGWNDTNAIAGCSISAHPSVRYAPDLLCVIRELSAVAELDWKRAAIARQP